MLKERRGWFAACMPSGMPDDGEDAWGTDKQRASAASEPVLLPDFLGQTDTFIAIAGTDDEYPHYAAC